MKKIDILDITKLILSFMVVAIHTELFPLVLYPWLRLAVPLFFVISAYLLFTKINNSKKEEHKEIIKHYILRLLKMYLFWFVILLPITIYVRREWFADGLIIGIKNILLRPIFDSTFVASWYISATIIGTLIVNQLTKKIDEKILLILFFIVYLICCCTSSYSFLFENSKIIKSIYTYMYIEPHCSFLISLIYILIGKILAENKLKINKNYNIIFIIVSLIFLYLEWLIIHKYNGTYNKDCYVFLLPSSVLIFNYIKDINIKINNSKYLRQLSNFMYPFHASFARIINTILSMFIYNETLKGCLNFILTLIVSIVVFIIVKKCESKFKILKYSY